MLDTIFKNRKTGKKNHRTACSWGEITMVHNNNNNKKMKLLRASKFNNTWGSNILLSHSSLSCFPSFYHFPLGIYQTTSLSPATHPLSRCVDIMWKPCLLVHIQSRMQPPDNRNSTTLDQLSILPFLPTFRMLFAAIPVISISF